VHREKAIPGHTIKVCGTFMPPYQQSKRLWYPLARKLGVIQSQTEHFTEEKNFLHPGKY